MRRLASLLRPPGRLAWGGALALALLAFLPAAGLAGAALRIAALLAAVGLAAAALRRAPEGPRALRLAERLPVGRESGLALVEASGRLLLVGYAPSGLSLLADLSPGSRP